MERVDRAKFARALVGTLARQHENVARLGVDEWVTLIRTMGHMYHLAVTQQYDKETVQWYLDSFHTGGR